MKQMNLSKLRVDKLTVQKQTAPLELQLVSNIVALYCTHIRIVGINGQRNGIITDIASAQLIL